MVRWDSVYKIKKQYAKDGFVIKIMLTDFEALIAAQPPGKRIELTFRTLFQGNISIFTGNIKGDGTEIYNAIVNYAKR